MSQPSQGQSSYGIAILGDATVEQRSVLEATLAKMVEDFGLVLGADFVVHDGKAMEGRNRSAAYAAAYFGGATQADQLQAQALFEASIPLIPVVGADASFEASIPTFLAFANGLRLRADDPGMTALAVALLECVGLLRSQRRVFVSYRRIESRSAAVQLHDLLASRGFDVFLDTHDIRPGDAFQDALWHRLCDSDVVVMLDTPTYFDSKWTRQELGRARAKEIHILRVVWPDHRPSPQTDFAETIYLSREELGGADGPIVDVVADSIVLAVESLRSRSVAARHMSISGKLTSEVIKIGGSVRGIGAHRAMSLLLPDGREIWAYPVVGIPTAELLNDIASKAKSAEQREAPILVYDHIGIRDAWMAHLGWLDENIKSVRAVKVAVAGWELAAW